MAKEYLRVTKFQPWGEQTNEQLQNKDMLL